MEIKLIKRELKNGRTSLVLEYYLGYTLGANGTTRPKRKFETLEYFLYTAPRNKAERDHNKINLEMAERSRPNGCSPSRTSSTDSPYRSRSAPTWSSLSAGWSSSARIRPATGVTGTAC